MKINSKRLLEDLKHLRTLTDTPGEGVTRFSYGAMDRQARTYILDIAAAFGAGLTQDGVGNIRIGLPGNRPHQKTILAGSHIDTVRNGGWLDGVYGSISALEVLRTLTESGRPFDKNFEVVIFAEEEGSNFDSTLTGSKFIAGIYGPDKLDHLKNKDGGSLREMLQAAGMPLAAGQPSDAAGKLTQPSEAEASLVPALPGLPWDFTDIEAMVELHIEQGPVLAREGIGIGIVDSIFGMRLVEFELTGLGNHAGASPMDGRADALAAAAACILLVEKIGRQASGHRGVDVHGLAGGSSAGSDSKPVATAGKIQVFPNCTNVIPEKVIFTVEVRYKDDKVMEEIIEAIRGEAERRMVGMSVREVAQNKAILLPDAMVKKMTELADLRGLDFHVMGSGAVHDASMMAQFVDTGMIFVPSIGGRSHVKEEDTKETDLINGANLLLDVVQSLLEKETGKS